MAIATAEPKEAKQPEPIAPSKPKLPPRPQVGDIVIYAQNSGHKHAGVEPIVNQPQPAIVCGAIMDKDGQWAGALTLTVFEFPAPHVAPAVPFDEGGRPGTWRLRK